MLSSCKLTSAVSHVQLFVARDGSTMEFYWWGMEQRGSPFSGLAISPTGSSRIHGAKGGENMGIIAFVGAMVRVE